MIEFSAVYKRYPGGYEALKNVSFSVAAGELVFLTGHSGAGKSTLLKLIPVIERVNSGSVIIGGQNVASLRANAIPFLRRNIGQIFQDQKLLYDRSVFDNVMLPLAVTGVHPRDGAKRARAALDKVGLLAREKANPIALSGGEQQRLAIARAIVNRPSILIADEPTANLDAGYAAEIIDLFAAFNQVGVTLLIATHDHNAVTRAQARVKTRSVELKSGELVA
jgi:cell division transport system ATP-binding protein